MFGFRFSRGTALGACTVFLLAFLLVTGCRAPTFVETPSFSLEQGDYDTPSRSR